MKPPSRAKSASLGQVMTEPWQECPVNEREFSTFDSATEAEHWRHLHRAVTFIEHHLASRFSVTDVARAAYYTERHLQRVFRERLGESIQDHIRRLRVNLSAQLLTAFDWQVTEISQAVGFETPSGFNKAFRAAHGCTPTEYRQRTKRPLDPPPPIAVRQGNMPTLRVAFLRHIGHELQAGRTWARLLTWAWKRKLLRDRPPVLGLIHDHEETPLTHRRYDAAIAIDETVEPSGGVGVKEIPGGQMLLHDFRGTVEELEARWALFADRWFPISGHGLRLPLAIDFYRWPNAPLPKLLAQILSGSLTVHVTLGLPIGEREIDGRWM